MAEYKLPSGGVGVRGSSGPAACLLLVPTQRLRPFPRPLLPSTQGHEGKTKLGEERLPATRPGAHLQRWPHLTGWHQRGIELVHSAPHLPVAAKLSGGRGGRFLEPWGLRRVAPQPTPPRLFPGPFHTLAFQTCQSHPQMPISSQQTDCLFWTLLPALFLCTP